MSNKYNVTLKAFASSIWKIVKTDRDCNLAGGGFTGEGKSAFVTHVMKEYAKVSRMKWDYNYITWSRKELLEWIDGKKNGKVLKSGLVQGQLPEYSAIDVDELFLLFYKRNWYDEGQIDAIATLNMCRDRHLFIGGCIPNFWDLDSAFTSRIRFYFYIPRRGVAWIFEQENNPFATDPWNKNLNKKIFRKLKNPYLCPNFVFEIRFPDWSPREKKLYYGIRNKKRIFAIDDSKKEKIEKYRDIKTQRDKLIRLLMNNNNDMIRNHKALCKGAGIKKLSFKDLSDILGISQSAVRMIFIGSR